MGISDAVPAALLVHPDVRGVTLVGSRAHGTAVTLSDWDFVVDVEDGDRVAAALPELVAALEPLAEQWDRLGPEDYACYMLMLPGPAKVDLIFPDLPHRRSPPWEPSAETLAAIDRHVWDWVLWLAAKQEAGNDHLVRGQLELMSAHLLRPMGVAAVPRSIDSATGSYLEARDRLEARFGVAVDRRLQEAVLPALRHRTRGERDR